MNNNLKNMVCPSREGRKTGTYFVKRNVRLRIKNRSLSARSTYRIIISYGIYINKKLPNNPKYIGTILNILERT